MRSFRPARSCFASVHYSCTLQRKGSQKHLLPGTFLYMTVQFLGRSCQKATALAAATFSESTPLDIGIITL